MLAARQHSGLSRMLAALKAFYTDFYPLQSKYQIHTDQDAQRLHADAFVMALRTTQAYPDATPPELLMFLCSFAFPEVMMIML